MSDEKPNKSKRENKAKAEKKSAGGQESFSELQTSADLRTFLQSLRDKMGDDSAPAVYALSAVNHLLSLDNIYDILDNENKEIARDIWLRIKQSGFNVRNPPMLFGSDEQQAP